VWLHSFIFAEEAFDELPLEDGRKNDSLSSERFGHYCTQCCVVGGFVMI
jgi:hypothetical protein